MALYQSAIDNPSFSAASARTVIGLGAAPFNPASIRVTVAAIVNVTAGIVWEE